VASVRRRTKILATLGPATDPPGVLEALVREGMDGARINCAHGTPEDWRARAAGVRSAAAAAGRPIALLMDLAGPKMRLSSNIEERELERGDEVAFAAAGAGVDGAIPVDWHGFAELVSAGRSELVVGDGTPRLTAVRIEGEGDGRRVIGRVVRPGMLGPRKGLAVTFAHREAPALSERDLADLDIAVELCADLIALSFVRSAADIRALRHELVARGSRARVVAKIEKAEAIEALEPIIAEADAIMVARGDLGVEVGVARVPLLQKDIIRRSTEAGRLVITATQMLESMVRSPEPTRAEATDVANAVIDGTSALMLSGETAAGRYPVEAVAAMAEIALEAEGVESVPSHATLREADEAAVMHAAVMLAGAIDARAIVVPTSTGGSARACARHRPRQLIIALALSQEVANQLALEWGVVARVVEGAETLDDFIEKVLRGAQAAARLPYGAQVVLTYGPVVNRPGSTSFIVVRRLERPRPGHAPWRQAIHRSPDRPVRRGR
jgi:pyruvate kinase